jgi:hypothetical protein
MSYQLYIVHRNFRVGMDALEILRRVGGAVANIGGETLCEEVKQSAVVFVPGGIPYLDPSTGIERFLFILPSDIEKRKHFIETHGVRVPGWALSANTLVLIRPFMEIPKSNKKACIQQWKNFEARLQKFHREQTSAEIHVRSRSKNRGIRRRYKRAQEKIWALL